MYQIGEKVIYGIHGVCVVAALEERTIDRKKVTYLALEPVGQEGCRYLVPSHNAVAMAKLRPVLTQDQLEAMLTAEDIRKNVWIADENQRKQVYRELISSGDRIRLMQMVCTLYRHRAAQSAAGRKNHLCDENFLRDAEKLLTGEVALVLNLEPDAAKQYIRSKLKEDA